MCVCTQWLICTIKPDVLLLSCPKFATTCKNFPNQHSSELIYLAEISTKVLPILVVAFQYDTDITELYMGQYYSDTNNRRWILRGAIAVLRQAVSCVRVRDLHCVSSLKYVTGIDGKIVWFLTKRFPLQEDWASNWPDLFLPDSTLVQIISYIFFPPSSSLAWDGDAEKWLMIKTQRFVTFRQILLSWKWRHRPWWRIILLVLFVAGNSER